MGSMLQHTWSIYYIVVFMLHGNTIHVLLRCMERRGKEGHTDLMA